MKTRLFVLMLMASPICSIPAQSVSYPPPAFQIAAAVSPLPEKMQAGARVLGYNSAGKLVVLRQGTNDMTCIADNPAGKMFHVACYHKSLEPFMARGRELHPIYKTIDEVDSVRAIDVRQGKLTMPSKPAALYQYFAPRDSVNMTTKTIDGAQYLYVVYTPYATNKTTGVAEVPVDGGPWLMYPGKPWAHLMISPQKTARITIKF